MFAIILIVIALIFFGSLFKAIAVAFSVFKAVFELCFSFGFIVVGLIFVIILLL